MQLLNKRFLVVGTILCLTFLARAAIAQPIADRDSGDGSTCSSTASSNYASCVDSHAWYAAALCAAQYVTDDFGCVAEALADID
jgi:hypothetical protein